jgi:hypothetical protein
MVDKGKVVCHLFKETLGTELVCSILDPSTAFKPRSGERGKKSRSGSTLSMSRAPVLSILRSSLLQRTGVAVLLRRVEEHGVGEGLTITPNVSIM